MDDRPAVIPIPFRVAAKIPSAALRINLKLHVCLFPAKAPLRRNSYVRKNQSRLQRNGPRLFTPNPQKAVRGRPKPLRPAPSAPPAPPNPLHPATPPPSSHPSPPPS